MLYFMRKIFPAFVLLSLPAVEYGDTASTDGNHEALHFTRYFPQANYDVLKLKKYRYPGLDVPTATACPAKSTDEDAFNKHNSFGKNSLFVRKIYEKVPTSSHVDYYICDNPYKMSAIYDKDNVEFQFGFEIYYDKTKYGSDTFDDSVRGVYDLLLISDVPGIPYLSRVEPFRGMFRIPLQPPLYLDNARTTELGFVWMHAFQTKYDFETNRFIQNLYHLPQPTRGRHKCDNYDLEKDFYHGLEINTLYQEDNQKRMLEGVKLPLSGSDGEYEKIACESDNRCFTKWSSVPAEIFQYPAADPVSCSDIVTAPIWKSTIKDMLDKLDSFLYALSQEFGQPVGQINVISGIQGVLKLRTDPENTELTKTITLSPSKKGMPVPNIIYKLVQYKVEICKNPEETDAEKNASENKTDNTDNNASENRTDTENDESETPPNCKSASAAVIIVIHNDPYFDPETDKICTDMCIALGWEEIQMNRTADEVFQSKYIYCCAANDTEVRKKLGLENGYGNLEIVSATGEFSLKSLPVYDYEFKKFIPWNAHDIVVRNYILNELGLAYSMTENNNLGLQNLQIEEPANNGDESARSEIETENPSDKNDD